MTSSNKHYLTHGNKNVVNSIHADRRRDSEFYEFEDFDNKSSWILDEIDMLVGMGFVIEGNTHMSLDIPGDLDVARYAVCKDKKKGYCLTMNDRNHYFKTFENMMTKIDELGSIENT